MGRPLAMTLALGMVLTGCAPRPRAPALMQGEAVYVNAQEGFRFVPPPSWSLHGRSEFPAGPATEERLLVAYRHVVGESVATLDVSMADVAPSEDLAVVLKERDLGQGWKAAGPAETLQWDGRRAVRAAFRSNSSGGANDFKEVVAVRKGSRVYFFMAVFSPEDEQAREQVRKSVETLCFP